MAKRLNWSRPLPRPIVIPKVMALKTIADIRVLVVTHLPAERRQLVTWQTVERHMNQAAAGGDIELCAVSLRMVLMFERVDAR
jgi:hypothetical protein